MYDMGELLMALNGVHIVKGEMAKFEEYKKIFDGCSILRHYENNLYEWMEAGLAAEEVYIAEDRNGEAVGFLWMQMHSAYAGLPYVALLGVRKDYRARGVGKKLLQFFIDVYEKVGFERALIAVNDFNPRARKLYEDMGFHKLMQYEDAMQTGNNVYLLSRKSKSNYNIGIEAEG